jgi:hypothetical protein
MLLLRDRWSERVQEEHSALQKSALTFSSEDLVLAALFGADLCP